MPTMRRQSGKATSRDAQRRCGTPQTKTPGASGAVKRSAPTEADSETSAAEAIAEIQIQGRRITIYQTTGTEPLIADGQMCHGYYDPDRHRIFLDGRGPVTFRAATLAHEIGHCVLHLLGMSRFFASQLEEDLLEVFLPAYLSAIAVSTIGHDALICLLDAPRRAAPKRRRRK